MRILFLLTLIFAFIGCSNDFELIEEKKDIPIVYGLLSLSEDNQYIRIEKAFVDETTSAVELALDPSNLYYDSLTVYIQNENDLDRRFTLVRINGDDDGLPRREGAFAQTPNYVYKILSSEIDFVPGDKYILNIERGDDLEKVTAETTLIETTNLIKPSSSSGSQLSFREIDDTQFRWRAGEFAEIFDVTLVFKYKERPSAGGSFEDKEIKWLVEKNIEEEEINVSGLSFFEFIRREIPEDPTLIRRVTNVDVLLACGGEEVKNYVNVSAANLGITSTQDIPAFTNLSEGRGIFSSRTIVERLNVPLTNQTLDSLVNGRITGNLGFEF